MVKIKNVFGDEYRGKQKHAVYQKRYGKQIRRLKEDKKANRAPAQLEQQRRFKIGISWYKSLSYFEKEGLKFFLDQRGITLTPQQYAIKTALDRGKVTKIVLGEQVIGEGAVEGWDAEGWPYRQKIDITSQLSQDLVDFQVKLELDASKVGPHFRWDLMGADLRFYDNGGTKIPYYIESWDEVNKQAVVWIKVPLIQQNAGADISMYYGKEDAVSESDGEAVFEFFDDFDRSELGGGYYVRAGTGYSVHDSVLDMSKDETIQIESTSKFNGYNDKLILEQKIRNRNTRLVGWARWSGSVYFDEWAGFGDQPDNRFRIETNNDNWGTTYNLNDAQWKILRLEWTDTMMRLSALNLDYTQITSLTKTQSDGNGIQQGDLQFVWYVYSGDSSQILEVDWVRVRKYAEQEPSIEFGAEEEAGPGEPVTITVEHIIVEHSGMQNVMILDENGELIKEYTDLSDIASGDIATRLDFINRTGKTIRTVIIESISGVLNKVVL